MFFFYFSSLMCYFTLFVNTPDSPMYEFSFKFLYCDSMGCCCWISVFLLLLPSCSVSLTLLWFLVVKYLFIFFSFFTLCLSILLLLHSSWLPSISLTLSHSRFCPCTRSYLGIMCVKRTKKTHKLFFPLARKFCFCLHFLPVARCFQVVVLRFLHPI